MDGGVFNSAPIEALMFSTVSPESIGRIAPREALRSLASIAETVSVTTGGATFNSAFVGAALL